MLEQLQSMLSGGQQRNEFEDFVGRYEQGPPYRGISDDEAWQRYEQVAPQLPDDVYRDSAEAAFARLSPDERMEFARFLQQRSQGRGSGGLIESVDERFQDPRTLAETTSRVRREQPEMLQQLLGSGGTFSNPIAKAAIAGITAMAAQKIFGRR